jgi:hypothetical protein
MEFYDRALLHLSELAKVASIATNRYDLAVVAVLGEVPDEPKCLQSLWRVIRPGGVVAFHEHFPDPDFIKSDDLRSKVEKEAFSFHRQFGSSWNYTALFTKPTLPAD